LLTIIASILSLAGSLSAKNLTSKAPEQALNLLNLIDSASNAWVGYDNDYCYRYPWLCGESYGGGYGGYGYSGGGYGRYGHGHFDHQGRYGHGGEHHGMAGHGGEHHGGGAAHMGGGTHGEGAGQVEHGHR